MGVVSEIQWTDATFNPWWGCVKVSPACTSCYAETFAKRVGQQVWGANAPRRLFGDKHWNEPRKWAPGTKVFCASMADVFEDRRDLDEHRTRLWKLIEETPHLTWLLLTKRTDRIMALVPQHWDRPAPYGTNQPPRPGEPNATGFPANVWIGTTVEDQKRADERIPHLLDIPARVRFLSCEPLLGAINLTDVAGGHCDSDRMSAFEGYSVCDHGHGQGLRRGISWVIAGCESRGAHAGRATHDDWLRSLRDHCAAANVPFFLKQTAVDGKIDHAPILDGREHLAFPVLA